ncbi:hypothetical protein SLS63_002283 [Diaporthe eres]|uniref:AAA+ ATPase domain-containing protein n=1 Tax=Diaporthe eres TaxID=83184 RepID=A0ABR1PKN5_DIAER
MNLFMKIKHLVDTARRQDVNLTQEGFGAVFMGSPGSGKSTVAGLYAQFLSVLGVVPTLIFEQTTGTRLADGGVTGCKAIIARLEEANDGDGDTNPRSKMRGVIFIDGADKMVPDGANKTFNYLMDEVQRLQGQVIFLFAGPLQKMQSFMSPSLRSQVPFTFRFDDFADGELHQILVQQLQSKFQGKMRVEGGVNGVFMRILTRRIGRGRGGGCFANARDVHDALLRVLLRQANRLSQSRRLQEDPDDMFFDANRPHRASANLHIREEYSLEGAARHDRPCTNYERELAEKSLVETSLNKVFLGGPGTGKTTVAKYYAQILTELGLLSNGEVIVKSCNDFIGKYLGQSENLTKAILDSARGKVLIIDEAYGLARDNEYLEAVVDTIVSEVQATSTEDRAVLLLGYKDEMEEMFQEVNPGLARRFPLSSAFEFEDFSDEELRTILDKKLQAQGFTASEEAKKVAMEVLGRSRNRQNFGNAGEIDILLDRAKAAQQIRLNDLKGNRSTSLITEFKEVDFDPDYDRQDRAESNIQADFADFVGADALVAKFQAYQRIAQNSKGIGLDPREQIPFNFIFRGPPGTGKTTTARKLGQIFFDMGFLATKEVEVCSASELIAEYLGQTGPKTQRVFQKALGKVLFIDEAYRLADKWYGKVAVGEIINLLTLPKYKNRMVVVLAGYDQDINYLLATNPGFGSRFSEVIEFSNLSPNHCYQLLVRLLQDRKLGVGSLHYKGNVEKIQASFQTLSHLPGWGNARDVENLATSLFGKVISDPLAVSPHCLNVPFKWVNEKMNEMITERRKRAKDAARSKTATDQQAD